MKTPNDPSVSDDAASSTYPLQAVDGAQDDQRILAALNGTAVLYGGVVSVHSGGGGVDVTAGRATIDGVEFSWTAASNVVVSAAPAGSSRVDQVVVNSAGTVSVVTGTAGSPYAVEKTVAQNGYGTNTIIVLAAIYHIAGSAAFSSATQLLDKRVVVRNRPLASGWCVDDNTWTVTTSGAAGTAASGASAATADTQAIFTVAGDYRRRYRKGTRLRWYESGTEKFGCVALVSFASSTTTVTLMPMSSASQLAGPDTDAVFYSHEALPEGYSDWFGYTPTFSGFSAYGAHTARWNVIGTRCELFFSVTGNFTSSSATHSCTAPVAVANLTGSRGAPMWQAIDGGANLLPPGIAQMVNNSSTINLFPTAAQTNTWTTSGNAQWRFLVSYEI